MALQFISKESIPTYLALSSDISAGTIEGLAIIGATVFTTDDNQWYIVENDLSLSSYRLPITVAGGITIGEVAQGNASVTEAWLVNTAPTVMSVASTLNSTSTPLAGGGSFIGTFEDIGSYSNITVMITTDVDSADNGLRVDWSTDGVTHDDTDVFKIYAGQSKQFTFGVTSKYFHIEYYNGASAQSEFRLQVLLHRGTPKPSSHRVDDIIVQEDDAQLTKSVLTAKSPDGTFRNMGASPNGVLFVGIDDIQADAGFRVRTSQLSTLGDYKILGYDRPTLWNTVGTGTGLWTGNTYQMSVTSGQYLIRETKRFHTYFSGKSQMVEETVIGFSPQANVTKRLGYFSSSTAAPYSATFDGFYLESGGGTIALKVKRSGSETLSLDITNWSGYSNLGSYKNLSTWDNFTVVIFDFLWLGGAVLRLWVKTEHGFVLAHIFNFSGTAPNIFILSPNQPLRYEIVSTTGTGSMTYVCAQCSTEGSINESGSSRYVDTGNSVLALSATGTKYPVKAIRKQTAFRDIGILVEYVDALVSTANDYGKWSLEINPTLSAPLTYTNLVDSPISQANGNGTITVTTPGTIIAGGTLQSGMPLSSSQLLLNYLAWMGSSVDGTTDQYVLCITPVSGAMSVLAGIGFKVY